MKFRQVIQTTLLSLIIILAGCTDQLESQDIQIEDEESFSFGDPQVSNIKVKLEGRVLKKKYGYYDPTVPLTSAQLTFTNESGTSVVQTNSTGHYSVSLERGPYDVKVEKNGFYTLESSNGTVYTPRIGTFPQSRNFHLEPNSSNYRGEVLSYNDVTGYYETVPNVWIRVYKNNVKVDETYSDSNGKYSVVLPHGYNSIILVKSGYYITSVNETSTLGSLENDFFFYMTKK